MPARVPAPVNFALTPRRASMVLKRDGRHGDDGASLVVYP